MKPFNLADIKHLSTTTFCVTGFSGYVGRHLVSALIQAGARVFLIGRPGVELPAHAGAHVARRWDDPANLAKQLKALDNPTILNLAGHFVKEHAPTDIPALVDGNLGYPTLIFEALTLAGCDRIINVGTSWEFKDTGEKAPLNLYAALKSSNALILDWYTKHHPIKACSLRLNDTYGGQDTRAKLMPLLKSHAQSGTALQLGYSTQQINLLYISDVVHGILWAAGQLVEKQPSGIVDEAFLLGSETCSIGDLVGIIKDVAAPNLQVRFRSISGTPPPLRGVWTGAPRPAGWTPQTNLSTGIKSYFSSED